MGLPLVAQTLLGGVISAGGQYLANRQNAESVYRTNRNNYAIMQEQNAFNYKLWNEQNAYNTPLAQRKRYEEAGINPALALSNITPGIAQSLVSASSAPMQSVEYGNVLGAGMDGMLSTANNYIESIKADAAIKLTDAEIANKNADTMTKIITNDNLDQKFKNEAALLLSQTLKNQAEASRIQQLTPFEIKQIEANVSKLEQDRLYQSVLTDIAKYDLDELKPLEKQKILAEINNFGALAKYYLSGANLHAEQFKLVSKQILTEIERANNLKLDKDVILRTLGINEREAESRIYKNISEGDAYNSKSNNIGFENSLKELAAYLGIGDFVVKALK